MTSCTKKVIHQGDGSENLAAASLTNDRDVIWYKKNIESRVTPTVRDLLENYSKIPSSEVVSHVHTVRDKCWSIRAYPCTGLGLFLEPLINKHAAYPTLISRLESGAKLLEIGCFIGTDLRHLVSAGVPSKNIVAIDIVSHWDVGYYMFNDRDRFEANFIEADLLNVDAKHELAAMKGSFDVIYVAQVLHQWGWGKQVEACKAITEMCAKSAMVVGIQVGLLEGRLKHVKTDKADAYHFFHDPGTFQRMWDQAGEETGTKWKSESRLKTWEEMEMDSKDAAYLGPDARILEFCVTRMG